ncbi:hypothetical protein B0H10DRAFT_2186397 [Mycena sp. CBHHK59/15]|nr:hypothetical protein B0H10DRAFT_2186397 [Mycena sp. CBHHK59/15]
MSSALPVMWDTRGIRNPESVPNDIDAFVRAQLREQVVQPPNIIYMPVSWEETHTAHYVPGPSSTSLQQAPFICVITFTRIAHPRNWVSGRSAAPRAGVVIKAARNIIGLTPGHTVTPWQRSYVFRSIARQHDISRRHRSSDSFERGFSMEDPTQHLGLVAEGGMEIDYMMSYWKKTQL